MKEEMGIFSKKLQKSGMMSQLMHFLKFVYTSLYPNQNLLKYVLVNNRLYNIQKYVYMSWLLKVIFLCETLG